MTKHIADQDPVPADTYLSTEATAYRLGYTPQHVCRLIRSGKLVGQKVGRAWLVAERSVNGYLADQGTYRLPLGDSGATREDFPDTRDTRVESVNAGTDFTSFEEIFGAREPTLEQKRLAKQLAWANGAAPSETHHKIFLGDARQLSPIQGESVHLVVTSPPYFNLIEYENENGPDQQLGHIDDYQHFLNELDAVWQRCFDLLVPGGRMCVVVGDVCVARRQAGRHHVIPLHADISVRCRKIGFDYLTPILWAKIANMATEVGGSGGFLGKPYEPNAIIKSDVEYILLFRKPGSYRKPTKAQRALSLLEPEEHQRWFRSVWTDIQGEARRRGHPAPFPANLAYRLIKMFSFVGDTVLDPFWGTGSTTVGAIEAARSSIGFDIERRYLEIGRDRLTQLSATSVPASLEFNF